MADLGDEHLDEDLGDGLIEIVDDLADLFLKFGGGGDEERVGVEIGDDEDFAGEFIDGLNAAGRQLVEGGLGEAVGVLAAGAAGVAEGGGALADAVAGLAAGGNCLPSRIHREILARKRRQRVMAPSRSGKSRKKSHSTCD